MNFRDARRRRRAPALRFLAAATCLLLSSLATAVSADSAAGGKVLKARLDNGLQVVIVRNELAPVATTVMTYHVGANETPDGFPGTAHALEHMMFRGSPGLSAAQLSYISAAMGGDFDAQTRQTVTQYFFTVPASDLGVALHIQSIRMKDLLLTPALWKPERGAIEQEVAQDHSDPGYRMYQHLLSTLFQGTPYAHDALGTRPSFDKTTAGMLKSFYEHWYAPNNATLVIVGDVDPHKTLNRVRSLFRDIPSRTLPDRPDVQLQPVGKTRTLHLDTDRPYGLAVIATRFPGYGDPDYAAAEILSDVLANQRSKLSGLVPMGKAQGTDFQLELHPAAGLGYAIGAFARGADSQALLQSMRDILSDYASNGVPPDLVEAARRQEETATESQKNSISGLAMSWADALTVKGLQSPQQEIDDIRKVTVADVDRVAKKYLAADGSVTAILTPSSSGEPVSSRGFGGKESFTPSHAPAVKLPDWAARALHEIQVPKSSVDPTVSTLPNGLRLIVQPSDASRTVSVHGEVRNQPDLSVPEGQEGVDQVLGQLFSYGTDKLDRTAFNRALDEIGASESAGTDFGLQVLRTHFDRGLQLLAANVLRPRLPGHAFKVVRGQVRQSVAGELQSPDFKSSLALKGGLYPAHDPTLRHATPDTVQGLSLDDVKAYYGKVFRPDLTTIVVIGNIDPDRARQAVEKYFGDWHAKGPRPETALPPVPPNKPATVAVPDSSRVQDEVTLAETLGITRSSPDYYALKLGNQVLSGGFYASRLYSALREKTGLVYYVDSSVDAEEHRAHFAASYACDPPNVDKARHIVVRELRSMQEKPVSDSELHRARAQLVRGIPLSEASQDDIARGLLQRATHDLPLDEPVIAARNYMKLDPEAVKAAFSRWVRPGDFVQVTQGPSPQ